MASRLEPARGDVQGREAPAGQAARAGAGGGTLYFRVRAETSFGDKIILVGAGDELGDWDPLLGVAMATGAKEYPVWTSLAYAWDGAAPLEYKYVRLTGDGRAEWEANGGNRRLPPELLREAAQSRGQIEDFVVDDGTFGQIRDTGFGFPASVTIARPTASFDLEGTSGGPRLVVLGDAAAAGRGAWRFDGWAPQLGRALRDLYGYGCRHASEAGLTARKALQEFSERVSPHRPTVVLLAFGLDLEPLAHCPDHGRAGLCADFMKQLEGLVSKTWELGAVPVIGGLCPHDDYGPEHAAFLRQTDQKVKELGLPVLDWLRPLCSPQDCTWAEGLALDAAHPNTEGHRRMFVAIEAALFEPSRVAKEVARRAKGMKEDQVCFNDGKGFEVRYSAARRELTVTNTTQSEYQLSHGWGALQDAFAAARQEAPWSLTRGLYIARGGKEADGALGGSVALDGSGRLASSAAVPPGRTLVLLHSSLFRKAAGMRELFHDGNLGVSLSDDGALYVLNESDCDYNVHPMWQAVRLATRVLDQGVYEDGSGLPFRTAVISAHGLQSRVKVPAGSAVVLRRVGPLTDLTRVAVLPLGDRCSIRMLLHKIEYDGPCYPFDLTRTTSLADVADMVSTGFSEMWYQELLEYRHEEGRIFHKKWQNLSYAHEVDDGDDPVNNFGPVAARMAKRYEGRAARFDFACKHADKVLFVRTGVASRGEVTDLLTRVCARFPGMLASLLLISDQPTEEFQGLLGVTHVREHFDPDRMYEDMNYWVHCAHRFRGILDGQGINPRTLYWCPNNLKEAEQEMGEAAKAAAAAAPCDQGDASPSKVALMSRVDKFSHSNLFDLDPARVVAAEGQGA